MRSPEHLGTADAHAIDELAERGVAALAQRVTAPKTAGVLRRLSK